MFLIVSISLTSPFIQGYLAYGVPKSDMKLFSLMQKVGDYSFTGFLQSLSWFFILLVEIKLISMVQILQAAYTIGGQSLSAAYIEYIILKMKPPAHRPQIVWINYLVTCMFFPSTCYSSHKYASVHMHGLPSTLSL